MPIDTKISQLTWFEKIFGTFHAMPLQSVSNAFVFAVILLVGGILLAFVLFCLASRRTGILLLPHFIFYTGAYIF